MELPIHHRHLVKFLLLAVLCLADIAIGHEGHHHEHEEPTGTATDPEKPNHENHGGWNEEMELKKMTGLDLKYNNSDPERLIMEISSRTSGYVAIGFCANWTGTMENCDIVLGWVDDGGQPHLFDYHAVGNAAPILDAQQDYTLISSSQDESKTVIRFQRKWDTGDSEHDVNLKDNPVQLIWAWHPSDPSSQNEIPPHDKNTRSHTTKMVLLHPPEEPTSGATGKAFLTSQFQLFAALNFLLFALQF